LEQTISNLIKNAAPVEIFYLLQNFQSSYRQDVPASKTHQSRWVAPK